jgi:hypothetical protein
MGLKPEVQRATVDNSERGHSRPAIEIQNVLARLKGTDNIGAIMLSAHYDSVESSPGASDDGAGVAALLETLRALKAGDALKNDIIFLFTDGEEKGLLGAKAFVSEHEWADDVSLVFNFEARGIKGPVLMFETSALNNELIEEFSKVVPYPSATSYMYDIYRLLPNDTDFSVFKRAGIEGFNFAYIDGINYYHSPLDSPENLDQGSLQHLGDYALPLARHFGNIDRKFEDDEDAVYFDVLGAGLISYPGSWVKPLALGLILFFAVVVALGLRRGCLRPKEFALSSLIFPAKLISIPVVITLIWMLANLLRGGNRFRLLGESRNSHIFFAGFILLAIGLFCISAIWESRRASEKSMYLGAVAWWALLAVATAFLLPGVSYLFAIPALLCLAASAYWLSLDSSGPAPGLWLAIVSACAIPGLMLVAPALDLLSKGVGPTLYGALMLMVVMLTGLVSPHLRIIAQSNRKWLFAMTILCVGLALVIAAVFMDLYNINQPAVIFRLPVHPQIR